MSEHFDGSRYIAETIGTRVNSGRDPLVTGWQNILANILKSVRTYLVGGRLVTFEALREEEKRFFESLLNAVEIPGGAAALYIPPSVRHQMMYANRDKKAPEGGIYDVENPPDAGSIIGSRVDDDSVILNALFAHSPHTPAADIYESGRLIAGYTYHSIDECKADLTQLFHTYLGPGQG